MNIDATIEMECGLRDEIIKTSNRLYIIWSLIQGRNYAKAEDKKNIIETIRNFRLSWYEQVLRMGLHFMLQANRKTKHRKAWKTFKGHSILELEQTE
jgi:hypothetical protein